MDAKKFDGTISKFHKIGSIVLAMIFLLVLVFAIVSSPDLSETIKDAAAQFLPDDSVSITPDINYANSKDKQQTGDLYMPSAKVSSAAVAGDLGRKNPSAIILVHGGSWTKGDKRDLNDAGTARWLAKQGWIVFNINYRLSGNGGEFPNDILDVKKAIAYIRERQKSMHLDPDRIFVIGSSSGATTALLAAYGITFADEPSEKVMAVASISGPTMLEKVAANPYLKTYLQGYFKSPPSDKELAKLTSEMSPIERMQNAIPTICVHGDEDRNVPMEHSVELCKRLQAKGIECQLIPVQGAGHFIGGMSRNLALQKILDFFTKISDERAERPKETVDVSKTRSQ